MTPTPDCSRFCFFSPLSKALPAPLLLKAKETSELSGHTCAVLHQCLEQLSKQEEVGKELSHLNNECACHNKALLMLMLTFSVYSIWYLLYVCPKERDPSSVDFLQVSTFFPKRVLLFWALNKFDLK